MEVQDELMNLNQI